MNIRMPCQAIAAQVGGARFASVAATAIKSGGGGGGTTITTNTSLHRPAGKVAIPPARPSD